jgi:hypothetical protein
VFAVSETVVAVAPLEGADDTQADPLEVKTFPVVPTAVNPVPP